ncbi:hypothetical protein PANT_18d00084 [Moesziomyces antarcticus T-34]|uniref:SET domain-containing protein n=1 Tax=Pseudozyma antarctica (strain T-34) TaxID=1151754 RepID=M9M5I8_PSEA3|nr:hypothetical protein PANT_18d00084 [Moesziomyces antarcticus T-34]
MTAVHAGTELQAGMKTPAAEHGINALRNEAVASTHSPSPSLTSRINTRIQEAGSSRLNETRGGKGSNRIDATTCALQVPANWPSDVVFITQNLVAASVPDSIAEPYVLRPATASLRADEESESSEAVPTRSLPQATHNNGRAQTLYIDSIQDEVPVIIHPIDKTTPWCPESFHSTSRRLSCHPAAGSHGLFAGQDIEADTFVRAYLGVLHTKRDADFYSTYDLSLCHDHRLLDKSPNSDAAALADAVEAIKLDDEDENPTALYVDSRYWGNESRFVNDYRGIADRPNVEFRSFIQLDTSDGQAKFQMGLFTTRPLRKGQELVVNYGKSYWLHHDQLTLQQAQSAAPQPVKQAPKATVDPIQAMLNRSRMRVSRTAAHPHRPHHPPTPGSQQ